jgi:hypothetical protein
MTSTAEQSSAPRRLFLVSVPRTASNLLVQVLNIQNQPNVLTNKKAGYFLQNAYFLGTGKGYLYKPLSQWTDAEKTEYHSAYQRCIDDLEAHSSAALDQGKTLFTKEHAFWFVNSAIMVAPAESSGSLSFTNNHDHNNSLRLNHLTLPAQYPSPHIFSPDNHTIFPDSYLTTWHFTFIIRHPALA